MLSSVLASSANSEFSNLASLGVHYTMFDPGCLLLSAIIVGLFVAGPIALFGGGGDSNESGNSKPSLDQRPDMGERVAFEMERDWQRRMDNWQQDTNERQKWLNELDRNKDS